MDVHAHAMATFALQQAINASYFAIGRLYEEHKMWRNENYHYKGLFARPKTNPDGSFNLYHWDASFPGLPGSIWAPGKYNLLIAFENQYPNVPPIVVFTPKNVFHPNVFSGSGRVVFPPDWLPPYCVLDTLYRVQALIAQPDLRCFVHPEAYMDYKYRRTQYDQHIRKMSRKFK